MWNQALAFAEKGDWSFFFYLTSQEARDCL